MAQDLPDEGEEVFVTVGTALPRSDRALVRGVARYPNTISEGTFRLEHREVIDIGTFDSEEDGFGSVESAKRNLSSGTSGPYGPGLNEAYGEVWAYSPDEL